MTVNKAILLGRIAAKPKLKRTKTGLPFCTFNVGTSDSHRGQNGERTTVILWHQVAVFGVLSEKCVKFLKKGSSVYVEGKNNPRTWIDKRGLMHYGHEVVAEQVKFLSRRPKIRPHAEAVSETGAAGVPQFFKG